MKDQKEKMRLVATIREIYNRLSPEGRAALIAILEDRFSVGPPARK